MIQSNISDQEFLTIICILSDERLDKARLLHGKLSDEMRSKIRQTLVDGARGMYVAAFVSFPVRCHSHERPRAGSDG